MEGKMLLFLATSELSTYVVIEGRNRKKNGKMYNCLLKHKAEQLGTEKL